MGEDPPLKKEEGEREGERRGKRMVISIFF